MIPAPPATAPGWGVRHVVGVLGAGIIASVAAATLVIGQTGRELTDAELVGYVFMAQGLATVGAVMWVVRARGSGSMVRDVGLRFRPTDIWGIPLGAMMQVVLALALLPLLDLLGVEGPPQEVGRLAQDATGTTIVLVAFSVAVLAPLAEELLYRGLLLRLMRSRWSRWQAIAGSAAVFAVLHLLDPGAIAVVPALFVAGLVMGYAADARGDLGLAIALHAGFNLTAVVALLIA